MPGSPSTCFSLGTLGGPSHTSQTLNYGWALTCSGGEITKLKVICCTAVAQHRYLTQEGLEKHLGRKRKKNKGEREEPPGRKEGDCRDRPWAAVPGAQGAWPARSVVTGIHAMQTSMSKGNKVGRTEGSTALHTHGARLAHPNAATLGRVTRALLGPT